MPLSAGDEFRAVMSTLPPLVSPTEEVIPADAPSDTNSCSPLGNQLSPCSRQSRADSIAARRIHTESMDMNFLPSARSEGRAGGPRGGRGQRGAVRDSQVLVHFVGVQEPFGVVAVDARSDKLEFVRKMIEKHFADVIRGQTFLFVSRDGVTIRRSQEKELVAWNQTFEKVGPLWGCEQQTWKHHTFDDVRVRYHLFIRYENTGVASNARQPVKVEGALPDSLMNVKKEPEMPGRDDAQ